MQMLWEDHRLMIGSSFEQFLVLKKKNVFYYYYILRHMGMTVNVAWPFEKTNKQTNKKYSQSRFNSRIGMKFGGNWPSGF